MSKILIVSDDDQDIKNELALLRIRKQLGDDVVIMTVTEARKKGVSFF